MTNLATKAADILGRIRESRPVIHNITNFVVMNTTANVLLALGAAPIMAHAIEELDDISGISNALVINIGTLSKSWVESMTYAARLARIAGKPMILDPVGSGATKLRTDTACEIARFSAPTAIRGNASEILSLASAGGKTRGVDSANTTEEAMEAAKSLAGKRGNVVAVTGEKDFVTDGTRSLLISGGSPLMTSVTGTGCSASVMVAAFLAVEKDALLATASALALFKVVAENASVKSQGPGSFWVHVLDELYNITPKEFENSARIDSA
ncbi:MAG: hydroxyethylthiazole kinase [Pseudomonadota bacterium]